MPRPSPFEPGSVRGLIFDLDGTLVDSYAAIGDSLNHARAHYQLPPLSDDDVRRGVGRGLESLIAELVGEERVAQGVRLFRERYAEVFETATVALPGVRSVLSRLSAMGYPMTVASNKPARFSEPILERLGLLRFIARVEGPDRAGRTKPDPAMLRACLTAMGLPAAHALYVGDMVLDVESARAAGVPVVLVRGGSSDAQELDTTGELVIDSIGKLPDLLHRG